MFPSIILLDARNVLQVCFGGRWIVPASILCMVINGAFSGTGTDIRESLPIPLTPYEAKDFNRFWLLTPDSNFPGYQVAMIFLPLCLSHLVSKYLFWVIAWKWLPLCWGPCIIFWSAGTRFSYLIKFCFTQTTVSLIHYTINRPCSYFCAKF